MKFHYPFGATPLDTDEIEALIPQHISLQSELNEWEHMNISEAEEWVFAKKHKDIFSIKFIQMLHMKMFDQTWRWAGNFRRTMKNIGVEALQIPLELHKLCGDVAYQIDRKTIELDDIAARLHHRLVFIHAFPNGNGRHARLYTDTVLVNHGGRRFSWGKNDLSPPTRLREKYIEALRQADYQHNFDPLLKFVRS